MRIAGLEKCSMVDWPGRLAAVVFTQGCNLNCYYCHNRALIGRGEPDTFLDEDHVLNFLEKRRHFLDGVVISGGEPTLQPDLFRFVVAVKARGLSVKLDTNGTRPEVLERLFAAELLDYVAMDIKAPMAKVVSIAGCAMDTKALGRSIDLIMDSRVPYEFRTTVSPDLTYDDLVEIAYRICGAQRYVLQQYRQPSFEQHVADMRIALTPHTDKAISEFAAEIAPFVGLCETRGLTRETAARQPQLV